MRPFDVLYRSVPDEQISSLLSATNQAGLPTPTLTPSGSEEAEIAGDRQPMGAVDQVAGSGLPESWRRLRSLDGQAYTWPTLREPYDAYEVYAADTPRGGTVHIALGRAARYRIWGRDRAHVVAFLTGGSPQTPLTEFIATDDHETTSELLAVIRGRGEPKSKKMFGPGDPLPHAYTENFRIALYSDHIRARGAWAKMAVLVDEDQVEAMLNHALLQARRRGDV